jgi:hypothetical protein
MSIKDFFYVENARVSSLAGQMNEHGNKTVVVETKSLTQNIGLSGGLGSPAKSFIHVTANANKGNNDQKAETFNPYNQELSQFADYVAAQEFFPPQPYDVSQLRSIIGRVSLYDLQAFKSLLKDENISSLIKDKWSVIARHLDVSEIFEDFWADVTEKAASPSASQRNKYEEKKEAAALSAQKAEDKELLTKALLFGMTAFFKNKAYPVRTGVNHI